MFIPLLPFHQQCASQSAFLVHKTLHSSLPLCARSWNPSTDPVKSAFSNSTSFDSSVDAQEGMPSIVHDRVIKPASVQSAISQDEYKPVIWNAALQVLKQFLESQDAKIPWRALQSLILRNGNSTAPNDHTDGEHGKALTQCRSIKCKCQTFFTSRPESYDPSEEWAKTACDVQFTAMISTFLFCHETATHANVETLLPLSVSIFVRAEH